MKKALGITIVLPPVLGFAGAAIAGEDLWVARPFFGPDPCLSAGVGRRMFRPFTVEDPPEILDHPAHVGHRRRGSTGEVRCEVGVGKFDQWVVVGEWFLFVDVEHGLCGRMFGQPLGDRGLVHDEAPAGVEQDRVALHQAQEGGIDQTVIGLSSIDVDRERVAHLEEAFQRDRFGACAM